MPETESISFYVNIASRKIRRNLDSGFEKSDCISGISGRVLGILANAEEKNQPIYQKDIEKLLGIRRSSVNSLIANLEGTGYIERIPDTADARLKKLQLTQSGRDKITVISRIIDDFEHSLDAEFTQSEKTQLISFMKRIIDHFDCDSENSNTIKEDLHA